MNYIWNKFCCFCIIKIILKILWQIETKTKRKKKTLLYKKQNRNSKISIDHVDNNSNFDRFYYRVQ